VCLLQFSGDCDSEYIRVCDLRSLSFRFGLTPARTDTVRIIFRHSAYFVVVFISRKMAASEDDVVENGPMKLNPVLDVDLDEIDDKEFDIPSIDKPPTLESILSAPDEDFSIADNCIVDGTLQVGDTPTPHGIIGVGFRCHPLATAAGKVNPDLFPNPNLYFAIDGDIF